MTRQTWVVCGAEFIEGDVIRWHEGVFEASRYDRKHRIKLGERSITAQVLYDPLDANEMLELQILSSEGTRPYRTDDLIRRARRTISRGDTERLEWSDEEARTSVIASLPEAQRKVMEQAQQKVTPPAPLHSPSRPIQATATGSPWQRKRQATTGNYAAKR